MFNLVNSLILPMKSLWRISLIKSLSYPTAQIIFTGLKSSKKLYTTLSPKIKSQNTLERRNFGTVQNI